MLNRELVELAHQTGLGDVTLDDIQDVVQSPEEPMSNDELLELDQGVEMECPAGPSGITLHPAESSDGSAHDTTVEHVVCEVSSIIDVDTEVNERERAYARWLKIGHKFILASRDVTQNPNERLLVKNVVQGLLQSFQ